MTENDDPRDYSQMRVHSYLASEGADVVADIARRLADEGWRVEYMPGETRFRSTASALRAAALRAAARTARGAGETTERTR